MFVFHNFQSTTAAVLNLTTNNDSIPEQSETFTVQLSNPVTVGISQTGAATLVSGHSTAFVTIGPSDEPHGVIEFASITQPVRVNEGQGKVDLSVVRLKGKIGK